MRAVASRRGWTAHPARNDFEQGVKAVNDALWQGKLKIHQDCRNLRNEAAAYQWSETSERPVYGPDHALDCLRYAAMRYWPPRAMLVG